MRIVGDFDGTADVEPCGGVVAMSGGSDGWWRATLALAAGEYRFRYVADGVWYADYASNGIETSKLGLNSILVVPDWAGHPPATAEGRISARLGLATKSSGNGVKNDIYEITIPADTYSETIRGYVSGDIEWKGPTVDSDAEGASYELQITPSK